MAKPSPRSWLRLVSQEGKVRLLNMRLGRWILKAWDWELELQLSSSGSRCHLPQLSLYFVLCIHYYCVCRLQRPSAETLARSLFKDLGGVVYVVLCHIACAQQGAQITAPFAEISVAVRRIIRIMESSFLCYSAIAELG
ncbi:uncharacterized protein BDV17DRAFT_249824 [Aspergillus undulatus]|uniref:uncharacterized protein n=1 Tax=Aspergillus undulatus TaxID=1810928 RepID=UPI003CCCC2F1